VEVLPRADRRRSWTLEQTREIVSESLGPELTPTEVARKHGLSTGQIYTWRHQLLNVAALRCCRGRGSRPVSRSGSAELDR
jgi:transposase